MRVYSDVDEQTLEEINQAAKNFNLSKANLIAKAIDQFLHPPEQTGLDIDQLRADLDQARSDANKRWSEMNATKTENSQLKRDLEAAGSKNDQLLIKHDQLRAEIDQAKLETQGLQKDLEKFQEALKLKDQHISFLEATVHQALEKITPALPPSQEEAKAKHWWQFWR